MILTVTLNTSIDKFYFMDSVTPYSVMRVKRVNNTAGGKGLNVSRIAALGGEEVTAMGFVGGFQGQYFESLITDPHIHKAFTHCGIETRSCINIWNASNGLSTEYLEPGAPITQEDYERFMREFEGALQAADAVTISGSMPKGTPVDAYAHMISLCRQCGKPVLLDTSGETLRRGVEAKPSFVKPNTDEIADILGRSIGDRSEVIEAAKQLNESGIERVVVSLGADGALMACADGIFAGAPPRIRPVNTVGCGDSMVGGFALGYARGWSAEESMRYALAVSAANALSMETGCYHEEDLKELLPRISIERID